MVIETLLPAEKAHHLLEDEERTGEVRSNQRVDPQAHATNRGIAGAVKGAIMYAGLAILATAVMGYMAPAIVGSGGWGLGALGSAFGFGAAGFDLSVAGVTLIGLPILGSIIKGITGYNSGLKEATRHNQRIEQGHARGHGREREQEMGMTEGVIVAATPNLFETAQHEHTPLVEQESARNAPSGTSWANRVRPNGPRSNAQALAAQIEAERARTGELGA